jgi:polyferredoxin
MGYPRGLVSYTSENKLDGRPAKLLRPRLVGYVAMLLIMIVAFTIKISTRDVIDMTILRDRNQLYMQAPGGMIDNVYDVALMNMADTTQVFSIEVEGIPGAEVLGSQQIEVAGGDRLEFTLRIRANPMELDQAGTPIVFRATRNDDSSVTIERESRFLKPL